MKEVEPKRVGVRWQPPAVIYVYQQGQVLRMARIPVRNLEDENVVDKMYEKHGEDLLRGLERRYIERMINILRHHHGIDIEPDRLTEKTCSEKQSEIMATASESEKNSSKQTSNNTSDRGKYKIQDGGVGTLNNEQFHPNKLMPIDDSKNTSIYNRRKRADILKLLDQASQSADDNETDPDMKSTKENENNKKQKEISPGDKNNEILELISQDLNTVQKEKQNLVNIVKNNSYDLFNNKLPSFTINNKDIIEASDGKKCLDKINSNEIKKAEDNSEDTDLDLDDVDILLDPDQPTYRNEIDLLDDNDFWS